jgi:glycosyltransferase involved in cell wall biosynthesis
VSAVNPAIFYHPDAFVSHRADLKGRHAVGESFLKAYVRYANAPELRCFAKERSMAEQFAQQVRNFGGEKPVRWIAPGQFDALADAGCLFLPGPTLADSAWARYRYSDAAFSLCGVTHTLSSRGVTTGLADFIYSPVQEWDALICSSVCGRDVVREILNAQKDYVHERFGFYPSVEPRLPIIPHGIECEAFVFSPEVRKGWRERLKIAATDIAVLFLGRLSFHAKANPAPMYLALERARATALGRVHLIQAGWFANEGIERAFREGATELCPNVNPIFLDGRKPDVRREIWAAADIFVSLSDNIQESFGISPVEAMAAGLPTVVSDWDGYRDSVRDGIDGFRIPTLAPPAPAGRLLAERYADDIDDYDHFIGYASQLVAVDVPACTDALARLFGDAALRRTMGAEGRKRALEIYDWPKVIRQYQELWSELSKLRQRATSLERKRAIPPHMPDPFADFASYPTAILQDEHVVELAEDATPELFDRRRELGLFRFVGNVLADPEDCRRLLAHLRGHRGQVRVKDLLAQAPDAKAARYRRGLVWLYKLDLVRIRANGS